jgi:ATP-dependent DNA helicase RecQ
MLFSYQDRYTQEFFIDKIGEDENGLPVDGADLEVQRGIEQRKRRAREKLDLVIRYAQTHRCRRQMILDYFGDEAEVENCRCDVCRGGNPAAADANVPGVVVPDEVTTLVRQILSAVARLRGKFGVGVVAEVLAGAANERTTRWNLEQLPTFGLLRAHSVKRIVAMLHRVMEAGLARQKDPDGVKFRPVVELTAAGVAVMKGEQAPPASLIDLVPARLSASRSSPSSGSASRRSDKLDHADDPAEQVDPETLDRFERLRQARLVLARERQLPPYCICHDSTLKLIARFAPPDPDALERIKGMGPHKVRMYGDTLLAALKGEERVESPGIESPGIESSDH